MYSSSSHSKQNIDQLEEGLASSPAGLSVSILTHMQCKSDLGTWNVMTWSNGVCNAGSVKNILLYRTWKWNFAWLLSFWRSEPPQFWAPHLRHNQTYLDGAMLEGTSAVVTGVVVLAPLFLFTAPFLTSLGLVVVDVFLGLKNEPNHVVCTYSTYSLLQ